jgi:hypothetical protein
VALPASVDRGIQVGGAVHFAASADRLAALLQDVERLEAGEGFLHAERLSDPPRRGVAGPEENGRTEPRPTRRFARA